MNVANMGAETIQHYTPKKCDLDASRVSGGPSNVTVP